MSAPLTPAPRYALSHELFVRALGAVALLAWLSLHVQIEALYGPRGILPLEQRVEALLERDGAAVLLELPSVFFVIGGSLPAQTAVVLTGEIAAALMALGVLPGALALLSFVLYLSFVSLGWPFVPLQWDTLLCEALVLGAILGRWRGVRPAELTEPHAVMRWAGFSLVTRLMLASGLVKLLSGDETWRDGSALAFHHWTQPLPSPLAPLFHAMPASVHVVETYATLALEIGVPFLVLAGPRGRRTAAAVFVGLMVLIGLSGSYGFFGPLTVALCIPLVDDEAILRLVPRLRSVAVREERSARRVAAGFYLALGAVAFVQSMGVPLPGVVETATDRLGRFHVAGHYGLFAVMTTDRPELVFEATLDAAAREGWAPYDFRYKPGDPDRGPRWATPHLPRFDWMLWFAALSAEPGVENLPPWVTRVAAGLLEDRAEVRGLFAELPLDGARPRAVRLVRARYRFGERGWVTEDRVVIATWRRRE